MTLIAFAGEDENHFRVVTALVDDALVTISTGSAMSSMAAARGAGCTARSDGTSTHPRTHTISGR
jgi:hypothetical protein